MHAAACTLYGSRVHQQPESLTLARRPTKAAALLTACANERAIRIHGYC